MPPELEIEEEELGFEKDDEIKSTESRIRELRKKADRTTEEEAEFSELKKKHRGKLTSQIEEEKLRAKRETERAERAERELEQLRAEKTKPTEKKLALGQAESIQINGKDFYTDRGLIQLVNAGTMSQEDAYAHQEERREEKAVSRLRQETAAQSESQVREEVKNKVLKEYPEFNPKHPDHDPNDPLFKEANEIWMAGLHSNPRGLEIAIEKAKRILGRDYKRPDLADELSVTKNQEPANRQGDKPKKVTLSESEAETAWSYYRTLKNPKTQRSYTQAEAIAAATRAKETRMNSRRV